MGYQQWIVMLDEQFLHANAESRGGDKLEKKNKQTNKM